MAAIAPYAPSVVFGFTLDDAHTILEHPGVRGRLSFVNLLLRDFWGRSFVNSIGSWRPLTTLTYWIDWHLAAGLPWAFHVGNLALYAVLLLVLARFLRRFFGAELALASRLVVVGVFGALAIHADVIPSATGRAEILAALCGLLALIAPLRLEGPVRAREVLLTAGASVLAMGAKESSLPIALLAPLFAYRWHAARGTDRRAPMIALTAASAAALFGIVAFRVLRMPWWSLGADRATENALLAAPPTERLLGAGEVFLEYMQHLTWPARLAPDYSYAGIVPGHATFRAAAGIALLVLILGGCVAGRKRAPGIPDAAAGLAASYIVVSNAIVPASAIADRLFFFPSLWVVILGTLFARRVATKTRQAIGALAIGFALAQASVATRDGLRWRDDITLLSSAVQARPTVARSRRNLALAFADAGQREDAAWQLIVANAILARYPRPLA
ncbi:MAG TPA: hypothetical protein VGY54_04970, partial [Polyangiaceae bacterium]|nr:hypothetical protein [Polyangiaceae bacterium]